MAELANRYHIVNKYMHRYKTAFRLKETLYFFCMYFVFAKLKHCIYLAAVSQHVIEEVDGWLTVCALSVNNTHSLLQAVTAGTAAAVPPARPHTGETAGVTPEEESTETEHTRTQTHALAGN